MTHYSFWKYDVDQEGNFILRLDCGPDTKQNVLKKAVLEELGQILDTLEHLTVGRVKTLIIASAKPDSFCAGADINEIKEFLDKPDAVGEYISQAHSILKKIRFAPFPVVAAVSGECLGGGLELAMICHGRVAADTPKTRFGLPETSLGIIPGFGGTQMLPRWVGLQKAIEVIVGQKKLSATDAWKCGLANRLVKPEELLIEAKALAETLRESSPDHRVTRSLEKVPLVGRRLILSAARKRVLKETHGNYPALLKALDAMELSYGELDDGLKKESELFMECLKTSQAKNLMDVFFLRKRARSCQWVNHPAVECPKCVGVLGAGVMGRGIAYSIISAGIPVVLYDPYPQAIAGAVIFMEKNLGKEVKRGKLTLEQALKRRNLLKVVWGKNLQPLSQADYVIEAALENLEVKRKLLAELNKCLGREVVVATNTSSLLPSDIVQGFPRPEYFCAMHFFNPAHVMDLVEIAGHPNTGAYAIARTVALTKAIGKTPLVLKKECPGLIVNRILIQYLAWGLYFVAKHGVDPWELDRKFEKFGMMMGPLKTVDLVGFDIGQHVMELMANYYPGELPKRSQLPNLLEDKTMLGQKSGKGFYLWQGNKPTTPNKESLKFIGKTAGNDSATAYEKVKARLETVPPKAAYEYIMSRMLTVADDLIREGVTDAWVIDLSMILGSGFSPARRGLLGKD